MEARTKKQIVLKKQKCGGFLFKIFEPKMSIRSTNVALAGNAIAALRSCCILKPNASLKNKFLYGNECK